MSGNVNIYQSIYSPPLDFLSAPIILKLGATTLIGKKFAHVYISNNSNVQTLMDLDYISKFKCASNFV